jgi:molybdopterin-binding protein
MSGRVRRKILSSALLAALALVSATQLELTAGDARLVALVTRPSFVELGLRKGEDVLACFENTAAHVIRRK